MTQMQARGAVNRNIQQPTPTGATQMQFDLSAYVGGSAQRTLLATGIINSGMTVNLLQADDGTPVLPDGSSLLYAQQQCKVASGGSGGGAGGGAGGGGGGGRGGGGGGCHTGGKRWDGLRRG